MSTQDETVGSIVPGSLDPNDITAHEAVLEELMTKIDESQETVDALREQIADTEVEISHLKNDILQLKKLKQKKTIECSYIGPEPEFDVSLLNPDHKDLINEMMDKIYSKELELEKLEKANQNLEDEVDSFTRENDELDQKIRAARIQIKKTKQENSYVRNSITMTQQKIKESEQDIRMNSQSLKLTSAAVRGLESRQEELETKDGGANELQKMIDSAEVEIALEQNDITKTVEQIERANEFHNDAIEQMNNELSSHNSLINWESEKANLQNEIRKTKEELKNAREENDNKNSSYAELFNRYRLLAPIVKKWCNSDLTQIQDEPDKEISALISQSNKASTKSVKVTDEKDEKLNEEKIKNGELEAIITKKRTQLEREMALFAAEEKRLKERIEYQRTRSFEEEHNIVAQMSKIKVKIAQIKNKKK